MQAYTLLPCFHPVHLTHVETSYTWIYCELNSEGEHLTFLYWELHRLQQYVKWELADVQAGCRKGRRTRGQIANIHIYFHFIDNAKAFDCVDHNKLWKILQEMGIPGHLTCLLRNLCAGQEATVRTGHGTTNWFQIGKGVGQGCIVSPCLFNFYAEYIMWNAGLDEHKLESRLLGEMPITSDMQMTPPSWKKAKKN